MQDQRSNPGDTMTLYTYNPRPMSIPNINLSKVKSRSRYDVAHLQPLTNFPSKYQLPTPYDSQKYSLDKILYVKVTTARSKVKSRSHHGVAHRAATILRLLGNETIQYNTRGKKSEPGLRKQLNIDVNLLQNSFFF